MMGYQNNRNDQYIRMLKNNEYSFHTNPSNMKPCKLSNVLRVFVFNSNNFGNKDNNVFQ